MSNLAVVPLAAESGAGVSPYVVGGLALVILFGALILAGREIQPQGIPAMIQGVILFSLILADVFVRYRIRFERRLATA